MFEIKLKAKQTLFATVTVEAKDEDDAKQLVKEMDAMCEIDWCENDDSTIKIKKSKFMLLEDREYEEIVDHAEIASIEVFHEFVEQINLTEGAVQ